MDHEAYENEMMDTINRHGGKAAEGETKAKWSMVMNKNDARILARGLKRMLIALFDGALFTLAVWGFIEAALVHGYLAVILFLVSLILLGAAFVLLYAQGINQKLAKEDRGESK